MNNTALNIIAICQIVYAVLGLLLVGGILYAIFAIKKLVNDKINDAFARIQPVVDQAQAIAQQARETSEKVGAKVDSIMTKAESTAEHVGEKMVSVTSKVESAINPQIANTAGMIGAALKAYQLYQDFMKIKQDSAKPASPVAQNTEIESELESEI